MGGLVIHGPRDHLHALCMGAVHNVGRDVRYITGIGDGTVLQCAVNDHCTSLAIGPLQTRWQPDNHCLCFTRRLGFLLAPFKNRNYRLVDPAVRVVLRESRMARAIMAMPRTKCSQLSAVLTGTKLAGVSANDQSVEPQDEVGDSAVEQVAAGLGVGAGHDARPVATGPRQRCRSARWRGHQQLLSGTRRVLDNRRLQSRAGEGPAAPVTSGCRGSAESPVPFPPER